MSMTGSCRISHNDNARPHRRRAFCNPEAEYQIDYYNEPLLILPLAVHSLDCIYQTTQVI